MREYGVLHVSFWTDPELSAMSDAANRLAAYYITGSHTTLIGCFRCPVGYVCSDLHWTAEKVAETERELGTRLVQRDGEWIFLPTYLRWNPIENPNQGKAAARLFEQVPARVSFHAGLAKALLNSPQTLPEQFRNRLSGLSHGFRNQDQDQDQDQEKEQEQEGPARTPARSTAPAVPASDPQAAPLAWKALREETGERLNAGKPFPSATGLPHALEQDWLRAWQEARTVYSPEDLRKLGRALKARAIWRMDSPITAGQLIKRLADLLAEATTWDGRAPPKAGPPADDPEAQKEAQARRRAREEALAQEVAAKARGEGAGDPPGPLWGMEEESLGGP